MQQNFVSFFTSLRSDYFLLFVIYQYSVHFFLLRYYPQLLARTFSRFPLSFVFISLVRDLSFQISFLRGSVTKNVSQSLHLFDFSVLSPPVLHFLPFLPINLPLSSLFSSLSFFLSLSLSLRPLDNSIPNASSFRQLSPCLFFFSVYHDSLRCIFYSSRLRCLLPALLSLCFYFLFSAQLPTSATAFMFEIRVEKLGVKFPRENLWSKIARNKNKIVNFRVKIFGVKCLEASG